MQLTTVAAFVAAFAAGASAHMSVVDPPVFRSRLNNLATTFDDNMVAPLEPTGSDFPCKKYHEDSTGVGSSKNYIAGQQAFFKTAGDEAAHNGGSCQVSLSFDNGKTWKVIKSFIGNCVRSVGGNVFDKNQDYSFTIPADAQAGSALWAWTWFNQTGNREMYMNCAHITIQGSGTSTLKDNPDMFVANVANGCKTTEGNDVDFPNPGNDVERSPAKDGAATAPPVGNCPAGNGSPAITPPVPPVTTTLPVPPVSTTTPPVSSVSTTTPPVPGESTPATIGRTYTVARGDICNKIAEANRISVATLLAANPSIDSGCTNLLVGQTLNLQRRSRIMREID